MQLLQHARTMNAEICKSRCRTEKIPVDGNDPINGATITDVSAIGDDNMYQSMRRIILIKKYVYEKTELMG